MIKKLKKCFFKKCQFLHFFSVKLSCDNFHQFSPSFKMVAVEKAKLKCAIELFYKNNTSKDKKNQTYHHFKRYKHNGSPIFSKRSLYRLIENLDKRGTLDRQAGSGRPLALSHGDQVKLKKLVNQKKFYLPPFVSITFLG